MYYQIKFNGNTYDACNVINQFSYDELISSLACETVEYIWIGDFWTVKPCQAFDKFVQQQTLSANNASDSRYYQIVEADSIDDLWAGKFKIVDVRNFEDAVRNCITPSYKLDIIERDRFRRFRKAKKSKKYEPRQHQKIYTYGGSPSMVHDFWKTRFMVEEFDQDEDIPNYIKIEAPTRPKKNKAIYLSIWDKTVVDENNWKSKKVRKQYMVNKSRHRYICKGDPFYTEEQFDQDELLQEYFDTFCNDYLDDYDDYDEDFIF